jgi:hypothetical protein
LCYICEAFAADGGAALLNLKIITMTAEEKVLEAMRKAGEPLNAGKIATLAGIDKKDVEKAMTRLKADGSIVSPKRCFWEPAK